MEMIAEAKTIIVYMICDKCKKGKMMPNGNVVLTTFPEQYPHKCDNCGKVVSYHIKYPYHKLVPIEPMRKEREDNHNERFD